MSLVTRFTVWQAGQPIVGNEFSTGLAAAGLSGWRLGLTKQVINHKDTTAIAAPPINTGG